MKWDEIVKFLISVTSLSAIIIYIGKKLVDKSLDAGIEKYKTNLNKELELFKSELNRVDTEHQIKYNRLSEQRADRINLLYKSLYELEQKLKYLTTMAQGPEWSTDTERAEDVRKHLSHLEEILELNRIYFKDELCGEIEAIIRESKKIETSIYSAKLERKKNEDYIKMNMRHLINNPTGPSDTWSQTDYHVRTDIKNARLKLANEFREILGVS